MRRTERLRQLENLVEPYWHAKQVKCFVRMVWGVVFSRVLGIAAIGRAIGGATTDKHRIKAVDRFLRSSIELTPLWRALLKLSAPRPHRHSWRVLALDWTDLGHDMETLMLAVPYQGRALPIAWASFVKGFYLRSRNRVETALCQMILSLTDSGQSRTLMVADRGFCRASLVKALKRHEIAFIIRIRRDVHIVDARCQAPVHHRRIARGQIRDLGWVRFGQDAQEPVRCVLAWARFSGTKQPKEPWYLITNVDAHKLSAEQVVRAYGLRFGIEQTFRDHKSVRFGLQMRCVRLQRPERWDRMLALAAIACWFFVALGRWVEQQQLHRRFRANTVARRTHSLFTLGRHWVDRLKSWPHISLAIPPPSEMRG